MRRDRLLIVAVVLIVVGIAGVSFVGLLGPSCGIHGIFGPRGETMPLLDQRFSCSSCLPVVVETPGKW